MPELPSDIFMFSYCENTIEQQFIVKFAHTCCFTIKTSSYMPNHVYAEGVDGLRERNPKRSAFSTIPGFP